MGPKDHLLTRSECTRHLLFKQVLMTEAETEVHDCEQNPSALNFYFFCTGTAGHNHIHRQEGQFLPDLTQFCLTPEKKSPALNAHLIHWSH